MRKDRAIVVFAMVLAFLVGLNFAQAQPKCPSLRALDGSCTNPAIIETAGRSAIIIASMRVSYFGTPAGTVAGKFIPIERIFRADTTLFGLPTNVLTTSTSTTITTTRSK